VLAFLDSRVDTAREKKRLCLAGRGGPTITASVSSKAEHKVEIMVVIQNLHPCESNISGELENEMKTSRTGCETFIAQQTCYADLLSNPIKWQRNS
jgi:hypothetical protein